MFIPSKLATVLKRKRRWSITGPNRGVKVKNHKNADPQIFFLFFDILEKTFRSIDSCNKNIVTRLVFLQIALLKWHKNAFIFT